ncbi:hypothetical protein [Sphingobium sp. Leaf26]|uniref:hypothetical protein n=1 Tax=Sphingobium sp. Leaf26 TaxID=1735693 RepID=UPI000AA145BC|nr:hypothetical protein [Sphingobium sp. Leaf26]
MAVVADRLLTDHTVTGIIGVGQLPGLMGPELASAFSEYLGRNVRFKALAPEKFRIFLEPLIGPAAANVAGFYEALSHATHNVIASNTSAQRRLGLVPQTVRQWLTYMSV